MFSQNISLGKSGEEEAGLFLEKNKYKIIDRNFRTRLGEIDIIALHKGTLCFIEVKLRQSVSQGLPKEAVSLRKQYQITKTALMYMQKHNIQENKIRFDVVTIDRTLPVEKQIEIIPNAFDAASI